VRLRALRRIIQWSAVGGWLILSLPALAALSQGYSADTKLAPGTLVALAGDGSGKVAAVDQTTAERLFGVVVAPSASSLSLTADSGQVQVVTSGRAEVFVTMAGGAIKTGDMIAVSQISGVGMKAAASGRVIGIAQADFTSQSPRGLGEIPVEVQVTNFTPPTSGNGAVVAVQNLANSLAGRPVASTRLLAALVILLIGVVSSTVLLYAAVRNSIVAIGRNPLARTAIFKGLVQILAVILAILAVSGFAIYLVIR